MIFMHIRPGEYMGMRYGVEVVFKNHIFSTDDDRLIGWLKGRSNYNVDFAECDEDGNPPECLGGRGFLHNRPAATIDLYKVAKRKDEILKAEKAQSPRHEIVPERQPPNPEQIRKQLTQLKEDADRAVVEKAIRSEKWPPGYTGNEITNSPFQTKKDAMKAIKDIEKRSTDQLIRYPSKCSGGWLIRTEDPNNASNYDKRKSKG